MTRMRPAFIQPAFSPEARRWIRRLEKVLSEAPPGIGLHGMEDGLVVADITHPDYDGDLTSINQRIWDDVLYSLKLGARHVYIDSGTW